MPPPKTDDGQGNCTYVLVTGANSGLGFGICHRLIDEFLLTRPATQTLHLIITTRTRQKSSATISRLQKHVHRNPIAKSQAYRVSLASHELDLCSLPTIHAASHTIIQTYPHLNAIICNAGMAGYIGLDWLKAITTILRHPVDGVTWPRFNLGAVGLVAPSQLLDDPNAKSSKAPPPLLGEVFTANVFGHYMLTHQLAELLASTPQHPGRILWISSIETIETAFSEQDLQCLASDKAYSSSKRLTDILALTSHLPSTAPFVRTFLPPRPSAPFTPTVEQYLCHPGVASTAIVPLPRILVLAMEAAFYIARWLGSPWHTISAYKGACAAVWLALASQSTLAGLEGREGKAKWGTATDWRGEERVVRTEVEGWGFGGTVVEEARWSRSKGRRRGARMLTAREREEFEGVGKRAWEQMEALRKEWEERLEW